MNEQLPVKRRSGGDTPGLSNAAIVKVFELLKGSNSVELKVMVPQGHRGAIPALGFDPVQAEPRQTYFFDTPDLALSKAGLFVRARRSPGGRGDTVVKLRPIDPREIEADLRRDQAFKIEVDANPGGYVCSGSAKGRCTSQEILDVTEGRKPLASIFSRRQRDFFRDHAPSGLKMKDLVPLGPTFLLRLKQQPKNFDRPVVVELWLYPDGSRILEISTKGSPEEAFQLAAQFRTFIADCEIPLETKAVMKTGTALAFHSKNRPSNKPS
jgi:hypothetical protein